MNAMKKKEIVELIKQVPWWYHSFEIVPGVTTPGICPVNAKEAFQRFDLNAELTGKRVLEIGTWDGPYAFELESRNAEVVATDIQDPDRTGFNTAKRILNSTVEYARTSVYDLTENLDGTFDIVVFMGVFYHLKYPILAFEQINKVLRDDGLLLFEGEYLSHYAETLEQKKINRLYRFILVLLAYSDIPITLCYPGKYKNESSNWHIPNIACVKSWMIATGFKIKTLQTLIGNNMTLQNGKFTFLKKGILQSLFSGETQRLFGTAVKTSSETLIEHGLL